MPAALEVWAAVPVKQFTGAKTRTGSVLSQAQREKLAATMVEDVLSALAGATRLAGILVNTVDPVAVALADRYGARVVTEGALDGHTGAVNGMARILTAEGRGALLTVPGDIPRVTSAEIDIVVGSALPAPSFTIVPAHDELGSNAVLCAPPFAVPLRFGDDSYFPHLMAARKAGIEPTIVRLPGIGLDIDHGADLRKLMAAQPRMPTRTLALLEEFGL
ncbi:2-phospho-L-lactate guanylyltransferase [Rhodopila sp.]|jgi:2-phospho-L-lactate guanylyltransferase|uniref:2-phospho-L-lactate guanylyltransferase n=1 Tax=Rhodopila sp. TaxID=2480087 RepID=UPI002C9211FE|nr:2-phospho-L-lactate guanylyltransferase [Rhodopila sp.]HVZ09485.1 2-phospho-L-lactate guanylyltransferase [Rhodopila sp.]